MEFAEKPYGKPFAFIEFSKRVVEIRTSPPDQLALAEPKLKTL
jgi:hypothetical protein